MNTAIEQMLRPYVIKNIHDQKNVMKEIIQEIVLCGLSLHPSGSCYVQDLIRLISSRRERT